MQVVVRGTGPALVMIHGWAMHGDVFEPLTTRLQAHFTLHLLDLPGHGRSRDSTVPFTLDTMARAIAALTPPAPWLGWSLGGLVALHAARARPDAVRGLLMLAASPRFVIAPDWPQGTQHAEAGPAPRSGAPAVPRDDTGHLPGLRQRGRPEGE